MNGWDERLADAKALLEANGHTVVKTTSYRRAQERQRIAEALRDAEVDRRQSVERWAEACLDRERRITDRLTHVYSVARAHGATDAELADDAMTTIRNLIALASGKPVTPLAAKLANSEWRRARALVGRLGQ